MAAKRNKPMKLKQPAVTAEMRRVGACVLAELSESYDQEYLAEEVYIAMRREAGAADV